MNTSIFLIAHRGASYDAPENTLAAVNLAWERNADAVEIDIHLSKDGRIVVIHDDNTIRTGGEDRNVAEQTLAELKLLDVGKFKGEQWTGQQIPALEEVLQTLPDKNKRLIIEIKCGPEILPELRSVIKKADIYPQQTELIGFDLTTLKLARKMFPEQKILWLSEINRNGKTGVWKPAVEELVEKARQTGLDGLNVRACGAVDEIFVGEIKSAGMRCYAWTVNDPLYARRLQNAGVDAITTDRPEWLRMKLQQFFRDCSDCSRSES